MVILGAGTSPATEPNDDFATATPISCPSFSSTATGIVNNDVDYYLLSGTAGFRIEIDVDTLVTSSLDSLTGTFDSGFAQLATSDDAPAPGEPPTSDSYLELFMPADGLLYVVVTSSGDDDFDGFVPMGGGTTGDYTLEVACMPLPDPPMPGDLLASTGQQGDALIDVDPSTGAGTMRARLNAVEPVTEIEFAPDGTLIGGTGGGGSRLVEIDTVTGAETLRCTHAPGSINGLEFVGSRLYGAHTINAGQPSNLVIIGDPDPSDVCALTVIGATGTANLGGLAWDADTQTMYGCAASFATGGNARLFTCDLSTGACTSVGFTGFDQCSALEFGPDGTLYGGIGGSSTDAGKLITINPATGAGTEVGPTGFPRVSGLSFFPSLCAAPATLCDSESVPCLTDPGTIAQEPVFVIQNPGVGFVTNVIEVEILHNGNELRTTAGATPQEQLQNSLRLLGTIPEDTMSATVSWTDMTTLLDPGEVVGYLATAESLCDGSDGPLGQGRGTIDASTLPQADP